MYTCTRLIAPILCVNLILSTAQTDWFAVRTFTNPKAQLNQTLINLVKKLPEPIAYIFVKKYIAGTQIKDAVIAVKELNKQGMVATLDILGESVTNKEESTRVKVQYLKTLDAIAQHKLDANISIKPTHFMLMTDPEFCFEQISELLERAKQYNNFVRIDMENSGTTSATMELYKRLHKTYNNVGIVAQANLKRMLADMQLPEFKDTNYRLCKGVYKEGNDIAYNDITLIRKNFMDIVKYLFDHGNYVAVATQDDVLIGNMYELIKKDNVAKNKFEFQTLYGVREDLRDKINHDGYKMRVYIPFGTNWYPYAMRRLQESTNVAWLLLAGLLAAVK